MCTCLLYTSECSIVAFTILQADGKAGSIFYNMVIGRDVATVSYTHLDVYKRQDRSKVSKLPPAFKIKGTPYEPYGNNVLQGVVSVSALKAAAKRSDATITEYLTALLILAIYREAVREELDDEPIVISVPVNLRSLFPSKTVRNFFCILNLSVPIRTGMNFESILAEVQRQIREKTSEENLLGAIAESCGCLLYTSRCV